MRKTRTARAAVELPTKPLFIRVTPSTYAAVRFMALLQEKSASALVRSAVNEYLERHDVKLAAGVR